MPHIYTDMTDTYPESLTAKMMDMNEIRVETLPQICTDITDTYPRKPTQKLTDKIDV